MDDGDVPALTCGATTTCTTPCTWLPAGGDAIAADGALSTRSCRDAAPLNPDAPAVTSQAASAAAASAGAVRVRTEAEPGTAWAGANAAEMPRGSPEIANCNGASMTGA